MDILQTITQEFNLTENHAKNIISLIDEGNTIPFIARYRKEMTGSCDDQVLRELNDRLTYLRNLEKRKEEVSAAIEEQGKMTDEIRSALEKAATLTEVEDVYRPYKQKRKTRASVAIAKGLQPLADAIFAQDKTLDVKKEAEKYITEEVPTAEEAISGAQDIIAEMISDDAATRKKIRNFFFNHGEISSSYVKGKEEEDEAKTYEMYKSYSEPVSEIKSHRVLALNRGEKEGFLKVSLVCDSDFAKRIAAAAFLKDGGESTKIVRAAAEDGYERLIAPSVEREVRAQLFDDASEQAIKMFEINLKPLLMQPPVKNKITMGWDPAFRTGCKICVVDGTGKVLDKTVVYPTPPQNKTEEAKKNAESAHRKVRSGSHFLRQRNGEQGKRNFYRRAHQGNQGGNGTGSGIRHRQRSGSQRILCQRAGRGRISRLRRHGAQRGVHCEKIAGSLAELIKIDPKSIGVGQYQHDMNEKRLDSALGGVLEDCVNSVGVDLNTASVSLLRYVAGLNSAVAKNIVAYREENGKFTSRKQLLKVPKLGEKAYTQCAGFLRIDCGDNILDNTAVHPESYEKAEKLLSLFSYTKEDVRARRISDLRDKLKAYGVDKAAKETDLDKATLADIVTELMKPGRDIRDALPAPMLRKDIMGIEDLKPGMEITGTVRNVVDFGAFVDIGVHQDGLVHISEITDKYIRHPSEVLKVGQVVKVTVKDVDIKKNRIALTMRKKNK